MTAVKTVRIGGGAGFSGDRIEPAVDLARDGQLDYLVFECLAERTIALAQLARAKDPRAGFDPLLEARFEAVLPVCRSNGVTIITNMGAANPVAAADAIAQLARGHGHQGTRIATVTGDDVLETIRAGEFIVTETGEPVSSLGDRLVSANAYIGAEPLVAALAGGAEVIVTGRAADPALFVAPLSHEFGWSFDDWAALGRGTLAGHLLECAAQVTGGYFADPGVKDVDRLVDVGFPIAEVPEQGPVVITKLPAAGGAVTPATCKEQMLYEIHDPSSYFTPDVVADFSGVRMRAVGKDRVEVDGATGRPRPATLKVSLGFRDGFIGEGQISYAGTGAPARAALAGKIVMERLARRGFSADDLRCDMVGVDALHPAEIGGPRTTPYEVRLRIAGRSTSMAAAQAVGNEVESLYTNGPAGGGGAVKTTREVLSVASTYIPRDLVRCCVAHQVA